MPQIMLGLGVDAQGNVTNLYTGGSFVDAQAAVDAAGQAGSISIGYVFKTPTSAVSVTLRTRPHRNRQRLRPVLQRMGGLFFIGLVMHLWEEGRFPGGFPEMVTEHLHFTARSRTFGEVVTAGCVLVIALVPLFLPNVPFLAMATMMLGFWRPSCISA
jgi:hypothetical protein